ncbi:phage major capsid protein [Vibrio parahaemolyticus]|nr:phage major capsid protein [Vibrio parahaemolyticus]EJK2425326.1 phage major capsid protein [Vibrio parahaemolyticus]
MSKEILDAIGQMATKSEIEATVAPVGEEVAELKSRLRDIEAKTSAGDLHGAIAEAKSIGEQFVESDEFKAIREGKATRSRIEVKAATNASALTWDQRLPGVVAAPRQDLSILDALPTLAANSHSLRYFREVLNGGNADVRADELAAFKETDYTLDEQTLDIQEVGHFTKLSGPMQEDNALVVSLINTRLPEQVAEKIQDQIVSGTGLNGQVKGLTHAENHVLFTPEPGDSSIESIRKAMAQAEAGKYNPQVLIMHPLDAAAFDLAKGTDGHFVAASVRDSNGARIWGLPIVKLTGIAQGSFMLVDTRYVSVVARNGMTIESSKSDGTDFQSNITTVRANQRVGLMVTRKEGVIYGQLESAA